MARVKKRTLSWQPVADAKEYWLYVGAATAGTPWLADVDAGLIEPPFQKITAPTITYTIKPSELADGNYQFAVCAVDAAGNISDPAQTPGVTNVPFDGTPPQPPTGLSIT